MKRIEQTGAMQLSDVVNGMAGVTLKDYGGVGGMKTISARGLGSQFSTVAIDGIPIDNTQNGQVDLGKYFLGNTAYVSFSQGQQNVPLLSARAFASGNMIDMETAVPQFTASERRRFKIGLEGGSFGLLSPTLQWERNWGRRLKSSVWANYLKSDGDYPFTLYYTASHNDSSSVERRKHSAVRLFTADGNLFFAPSHGKTLTTKIHYFDGEYELPGPVALYSQVVSGQRSKERLFFVQSRWRVTREQWAGQLLGKLRYSYDNYLDTTAGGYLSNTYRQGEAFLSGSLHRALSAWADVDVASDECLTHLESNVDLRNRVTRQHISAVVSTRLHWERWEIQAHLLYTRVDDHLNDVDTVPTWQRVTPYIALMYKMGERTTLRLFYKDTYRVPNFSELYFFQLIPRNLRPERAHQLNIGFTQAFVSSDGTISGQVTVDGYYNRVNDKIIARPTVNIYYWSMQNLGIVDILGVDATVQCHIDGVTLQGNYTFQSAVDHTDSKSATYGYQIVYTPRHSGGADVRWENWWVNLGFGMQMIGHRYSGAQNAADNRLPAYCDLTLHADRRINIGSGILALRLSLFNLLDTQYEIVAAYPMMGRNWRMGINYTF